MRTLQLLDLHMLLHQPLGDDAAGFGGRSALSTGTPRRHSTEASSERRSPDNYALIVVVGLCGTMRIGGMKWQRTSHHGPRRHMRRDSGAALAIEA